MASYRKMMRDRAWQQAKKGDKTCLAYFDLINSCPLASQIDELDDYSDDPSDIEMHY